MIIRILALISFIIASIAVLIVTVSAIHSSGRILSPRFIACLAIVGFVTGILPLLRSRGRSRLFAMVGVTIGILILSGMIAVRFISHPLSRVF